MAHSVSNLPRTSFFEAITSHDPQSTAVVNSDSAETFTYADLCCDVASSKTTVADQLQGRSNIAGERIAFLVENSYDYVGAPPPIPFVLSGASLPFLNQSAALAFAKFI